MEKIRAIVVSQKEIDKDIFDLVIKCPDVAREAIPGQFVSLYTDDPSKLLPRPISICFAEQEEGTLRLCYRVTSPSAGTKQFSELREGDSLFITGPLGNGYTLQEGSAILAGGGIGIPPMLYLAKKLADKGLKKEEIKVVLGFRDSTFLVEDFEKYAEVYISSDTGSVGVKGNVIDAMKKDQLSADTIYACGPKPMLKGLKAFSEETGTKLYISLEEKMACGIGACLACVCKTKSVDEHFGVNTKRICKDGPCFDAEEVEL